MWRIPSLLLALLYLLKVLYVHVGGCGVYDSQGSTSGVLPLELSTLVLKIESLSGQRLE